MRSKDEIVAAAAERQRRRTGFIGSVLRIARVTAVIVLLIALVLSVFQDGLIWHPRLYDADDTPPGRLVALPFTTSDGAQTAWWRAPDAPGLPRRVWVVFNGNASTAWDWVGFATAPPAPDIGVLIIDWPGFGRSAGNQSEPSILRAADGAEAALAQRLGMPPADLRARIAVLGHSMGTGAATAWVAQRGATGLILIAPYTSLGDMAWRQFGPFALMLKHDFNNRRRLAELLARPDAPPVLIVHGDADEVIPVDMGRRLAAGHPGRVRLLIVPGGDHNGVIDNAERELAAEMTR
jgi:pimeloyl-ACP methyl ester carboxylesterase